MRRKRGVGNLQREDSILGVIFLIHEKSKRTNKKMESRNKKEILRSERRVTAKYKAKKILSLKAKSAGVILGVLTNQGSRANCSQKWTGEKRKGSAVSMET